MSSCGSLSPHSPTVTNGYGNGNGDMPLSVFEQHFPQRASRSRKHRSGRASPAHSAHSALIRNSITQIQDGKRAKMVRFYRNGDKFFKGIAVAVSTDRFRTLDSLLQELTHNEHMTDNIKLPHGVRFIFTADGRKLNSLVEFQDDQLYIASSNEKFIKLEYHKIKGESMSKKPRDKSGRETPSSDGGNSAGSGDKSFIKPRLITIIRNGVKPRKAVRILLNKKTAHSFDQVLNDVTNAVQLTSGAVRKLFTLDGRQVTSLADFFRDDDIFIAYGQERCYHDDFDLDENELNRLNGRAVSRSSSSKVGPKSPLTPRKKIQVVNGGNDRLHLSPARNSFPTSPKSPRKIMQSPNRAKSPVPQQNGGGHVEGVPAEVTTSYKIGRVIGDGNFAVVKECIDRSSKKIYALKIIDKLKCKGKEQMIDSEVNILRQVKHPNIVLLLDEFHTKTHLYLVMELVKGGDLFDAISSSTKYTERDASGMVYNLASALKYLHVMSIVHRDIKPENLLVCEHEDGSKSLKLGDFGLAVEAHAPLYTVCGTPTYVAPEILAEIGYGVSVDVWAAGVITYILLCGFPPFVSVTSNQDELFDKILSGEFEFTRPYWDGVSASARELIGGMLHVNPERRYAADDVLNHPWVAEDDALDNDMHLTVSRKLSMHFNMHSRSSTNKQNQHQHPAAAAALLAVSNHQIPTNTTTNSSSSNNNCNLLSPLTQRPPARADVPQQRRRQQRLDNEAAAASPVLHAARS